MKNLIVLLALTILSCGNAPTESAQKETGGTSIEVALIKGVVVDEQNRPVKGAAVTFIGQSAIPNAPLAPISDSIRSDSNGSFSERVIYRGAMSVIVKDTSGNGAFKPCTLTTNDTIIDLDTIKLERLGSLIVTLDTTALEPSDQKSLNHKSFFTWSKEIVKFTFFDSTYSTSMIIIPAGEYSIRLSPAFAGLNSIFAVSETTVTVTPGVVTHLKISPTYNKAMIYSESLQKDMKTLFRIHSANGDPRTDTTKIPSGVSVMNNRIVHLYENFDTIPSIIDELDKLEWIFIENSHKLRSLPSTIGNLDNLTLLQLINCDSLQTLPMELAEARSLKCLEIALNHSFTELPEVIYLLPEYVIVSFDFHWVPSEREKEWALNRMFHGDRDSLVAWEANLISKYGTK